MRRELDPKGCQTSIYQDRGSSYQCSIKPIVERDGKLYCKIHNPEYIKEKHAKLRIKWNKKAEIRHQRLELSMARSRATEEITLAELKQVTPALIRRALREEKI